MGLLAVSALLPLSLTAADCDFAGKWTLESAKSQIRQRPFAAEEYLSVTCDSGTLEIESKHGKRAYSLKDEASSQTIGGASFSSRTKWQGDALLINSLSTSGRQFTLMENWRVSRDGATLTIRSQLLQGASEVESRLVYMREGASAKPPEPVAEPIPAPILTYTVGKGEHLLLRSVTTVSTKTVDVGSKLYFTVAVPVTEGRVVVIPKGAHVTATVTEVSRAGRARGKAELMLLFTSLSLPNGVTRELRSRLVSADGRSLDREEGKIRGDSSRGRDAAKVGTGAGTGAGVGRMGGQTGIGAAAGAAAGLASVLASRGPDIVVEEGASLEIELDRSISFEQTELRGR